jgi:hypothetical protein
MGGRHGAGYSVAGRQLADSSAIHQFLTLHARTQLPSENETGRFFLVDYWGQGISRQLSSVLARQSSVACGAQASSYGPPVNCELLSRTAVGVEKLAVRKESDGLCEVPK